MRYKIPLEIVELEHENYHLLVSSLFHDGTKGFWVIDTGASKTVFDKNLTKHIQQVEEETEDLHSASVGAEPLETSLALLKSFSLGKLKVENLKVALLDMNHINELYSKSANFRICGLLGSDFLMKFNSIINYKNRRLELKT